MKPTTIGPAEDPRRSQALPSTRADCTQPCRIDLGRIQVERECDSLHDRIGKSREDQHLGRRCRAEPCEAKQRKWCDQQCASVPALAADFVDQKRADDCGDHARRPM